MEKLDGFISESESETIEFGRRLGTEVKPGSVIALQGDLGSGKTHMVKGIAQALEIDPKEVHSPTFSLIHEHSGRMPLYHFDCYRMESVREAIEIGTEEYLYGEGLCVIEWPERIAALLPDEAIWIMLKNIDARKRQFNIKK